MGKARIIFEEEFSQPLFPDIDFADINWKSGSMSSSGMYKISGDDMLFKRKVRARTHVRKSMSRESDVNRTWTSKSYTGEMELEGYAGEEKYDFTIEFENGHLIEIRQL